jgi:MoaA/NifB/PqqE/SkfB family radical SAM enzyme
MSIQLMKHTMVRMMKPRTPTTIAIETSRKCNLSCDYCAVHKMLSEGTLKHVSMPLETYKELVARVKSFVGSRLQVFGLSGQQELLLDPTLHERIMLAKKSFPYARIAGVSNATLLKDEMLDVVVGNLDNLHLSLNLLNPDTYRNSMGADYTTTYNNIIHFFERKKEKRPDVTLQIFKTEENMKLLAPVVKDLNSVMGPHDQIIYNYIHNWAGKLKTENPPTPATHYPCKMPWFELFVSAEGDCYACCMGEAQPDLKVGNIFEESFSDIWFGRRLREIREAHLCNNFTKYPSCQNCFEWTKWPNDHFKFLGKWR